MSMPDYVKLVNTSKLPDKYKSLFVRWLETAYNEGREDYKNELKNLLGFVSSEDLFSDNE